jgi:hypothetical protein
MVSVEFDGPDQERQKRWIDTVLDAIDADPNPPSGGISGHFHVSLDGTRVLNYAEWEDEQSHQRAMEQTGEMTVIRGPNWQQVRDFKGVQRAGFKRYRLIYSLSIPDWDAAPVCKHKEWITGYPYIVRQGKDCVRSGSTPMEPRNRNASEV